MVMEMEEDAQIPIILGLPFLATVKAIKNEKLSLQVREEKLEFNLAQAMSSPTLEHACY